MQKGFADIHSHILPGADDGPESESEALSILKGMEDAGITDLILTPHYCKRRGYALPSQDIRTIYEVFRQKCIENGIGIRLMLGTELEYSADALRYIKEGRVNTLDGSKYILVEFPPYVKNTSVVKACKQILQTGLVPVVAHVERYECMHRHFEDIRQLRQTGALIQVNIRSVCSPSFRMRRFIKKIITERLADFLAGDVHDIPINNDEMAKCRSFVIKHADIKYLDELLIYNAQKIFNRR